MTTDAERRFANNGVQVGSVFIMKPDSAIDFVKLCKQDGIAVYGVEGFLRIDDGIQPQQEHSCDYDSPSDEGHSLTISFLEGRLETDLWFEVVTDEPTV
jgi:hypothetical protein